MIVWMLVGMSGSIRIHPSMSNHIYVGLDVHVTSRVVAGFNQIVGPTQDGLVLSKTTHSVGCFH